MSFQDSSVTSPACVGDWPWGPSDPVAPKAKSAEPSPSTSPIATDWPKKSADVRPQITLLASASAWPVDQFVRPRMMYASPPDRRRLLLLAAPDTPITTSAAPALLALPTASEVGIRSEGSMP
jgi:hypothetical protein